MNVSNEKLLNAAKCQGFCFWIIDRKPTGGVKLPPTEVRVNSVFLLVMAKSQEKMRLPHYQNFQQIKHPRSWCEIKATIFSWLDLISAAVLSYKINHNSDSTIALSREIDGKSTYLDLVDNYKRGSFILVIYTLLSQFYVIS